MIQHYLSVNFFNKLDRKEYSNLKLSASKKNEHQIIASHNSQPCASLGGEQGWSAKNCSGQEESW